MPTVANGIIQIYEIICKTDMYVPLAYILLYCDWK